MKKLKYIMADGSPILFGDAIQHKEVARGFNVTSAGFCSIDFVREDDRYKVSVYGESESIQKASNPNDAMKIEQMINYY